MGNLQSIVYLSEDEYNTLITNQSITKNGRTLTYNENSLYITPETGQEFYETIAKTVFTVPSSVSATPTQEGGVNPTTGHNMSGTQYYRTGYRNFTNNMLFKLNHNDYKYTMWLYSDNNIESKICSLTNQDWYSGLTLIPNDKGGLYFRICYTRKDGAAITTTDVETITANALLFEATDTSLSVAGAAADAKVVGDATAAIDGELTDLKSTLTAITEKSKNILPVTAQMNSFMGVTTSYSDGVISLEGTATGSGGRLNAVIGAFSLDAGTYTFSRTPSDLQVVIQSGSTIIAQTVENTRSATFTLTDATTVYVGLNVINERSYNAIYNVQLEIGSAATAIHSPTWVEAVDETARADARVHDVQVNGSSVLNNGIANITYASASSAGVIKTRESYGTAVDSGQLAIIRGTDAEIKAGNGGWKPIVPSRQHMATFYGLAKAAGDTTQSASSNAVGTYTDSAKTAIKSMLGIGSLSHVSVSGADPTILADIGVKYVCSTLNTLSFTPCPIGDCEVIFTSGSTPTVLTVPNTIKWPSWFDLTTLETNTIYDIIVSDGIYGVVTTWPS